MKTYIKVMTNDDRVSNVHYFVAFPLRDLAPDPEGMTGRVPAHVMRLAAAVQGLGNPGECTVYEVVESSEGEDCWIGGKIVLDGGGDIAWRPSEVGIEGPIVGELEVAIEEAGRSKQHGFDVTRYEPASVDES